MKNRLVITLTFSLLFSGLYGQHQRLIEFNRPPEKIEVSGALNFDLDIELYFKDLSAIKEVFIQKDHYENSSSENTMSFTITESGGNFLMNNETVIYNHTVRFLMPVVLLDNSEKIILTIYAVDKNGNNSEKLYYEIN